LGFRAVSVLRDFYVDTTEDAYLMQYRFHSGADDEMVAPVNRISRLAG
jgi:ribosomal-protein-alanine N-acetyltransferase